MRTVGSILRETRVEKLYSLEDIEKHTKIRKELLQALEEDDYDKLPPATFIQGFIKNYGRFLGLDTEKLLAIFRRDFEAKKHPPVVMKSFSKPIKQRKFRFTPTTVVGAVIALTVFGFFAYLYFEYRQYVGAPPLTVERPADQTSVEIPAVVVEGTTDPDAKLTINNQEVGLDQSGKFSIEIKLSSSTNMITVVSTSKFGQSSKVERTVFVKK